MEKKNAESKQLRIKERMRRNGRCAQREPGELDALKSSFFCFLLADLLYDFHFIEPDLGKQ